MDFNLSLSSALLAVAGLYELRLAYKMVKKKTYIMDLAPQIRVALIRKFWGPQKAKAYERELMKTRDWKYWSLASLITGLMAVIFGINFLLVGLSAGF